MKNTELLMNAGIDYPKGMERFMGDEELYDMVLAAFMEDTVLERAEKAFFEKDYKTLFRCAHEMKGASGNAEMPALYAASCELVELLREGVEESDAIETAYARFKEIYLRARSAVCAVLGDG